MALILLCFGVEFLCCLRLCTFAPIHVRGMAEKFIDTISIFNRKRNSVKMNISGFAKIFHEQIDEFL